MTCPHRSLSLLLTASGDIQSHRQQRKIPKLKTQWSIAIGYLSGKPTSLCVGCSVSASPGSPPLPVQEPIVTGATVGTSSSFPAVGVASGPRSCSSELNTCLSDAQWILQSLPMVVAVGKDEFLFSSENILSDWRFPMCFLSVLLVYHLLTGCPTPQLFIYVYINK